MDQSLKQSIGEHFSALMSIASPTSSLWPLTAQVLFPILRDLSNSKDPGANINYELYSGAGENALTVLAAGIVSNSAPRDNTWFNLRYRNPKFNELSGVPDFQKDREKLFYSMLSHSNFYEWLFEFCYEGGWACTAAGFIEPDHATKTLTFKLLPTGSYYIAEDSKGNVDTLGREFWMEGREIVRRWTDLPAEVAQKMQNQPYNKHKIRHLVRPREAYDPKDKGNKNFAWEATYTLVDDQNIVLEEGGFEFFPFLVWRFERQPNSPWGTGPGQKFIRDSQVLQTVSQDLLEADALTLRPVMQAPEGARAQGVPDTPGAVMWVPDNLLGKTGPINKGINRMVGADREDRLVQAIHKYFHFDYFLLDVQENKVKTRAEYLGKKAAVASVVAPVIGRFTSEVLDPMWRHLFRYAQEFGLLARPPQALIDAGASEPDVEYQSPLTTLQQRAHQQAGVEAFIQQGTAFNQFLGTAPAQVADAISAQEVVDLLLDSNGIGSVATDKQTRETAAKQRQQAAVLQAQQQAQLQGIAAAQGQAPK